MSFAERLARWNQWYDGLPEIWRFQFVLWPLLILGAINMALTISVGVPFAFLVVLGILAVACVRVPYVVGWVKADSTESATRIEIVAFPWIYSLNQWYDGLSEFRRPMVILGVLLVAGAINMALTINHGFPFGVLFLLALLALVLIRAPHAAGWYIAPSHGRLAVAHRTGQIARATSVGSDPLPVTHEMSHGSSGE